MIFFSFSTLTIISYEKNIDNHLYKKKKKSLQSSNSCGKVAIKIRVLCWSNKYGLRIYKKRQVWFTAFTFAKFANLLNHGLIIIILYNKIGYVFKHNGVWPYGVNFSFYFNNTMMVIFIFLPMMVCRERSRMSHVQKKKRSRMSYMSGKNKNWHDIKI
jgi:hypothetical protein